MMGFTVGSALRSGMWLVIDDMGDGNKVHR